MVEQVYRPRRPKASPLWQCLSGHFTFGIPKMLRTYFRFDRDLLKDLCRLAHECLIEYLRTTLDLPEGLPGIVMAIHTFPDYDTEPVMMYANG